MRKLRVPAVLVVGVVSIAASVASCKDDEECVVRCVPIPSDAGVAVDANACPEPVNDDCGPSCQVQYDHCFT